jgi:hypothetical protein
LFLFSSDFAIQEKVEVSSTGTISVSWSFWLHMTLLSIANELKVKAMTRQTLDGW